MKYPIGNQTFSKIIENGMVYVDKTDLVYELAQKSICFLSRPRRFGKSLTLSTLKSYFKGEKEWFRGLKMEQLEKDWKVYPVLHIDFATGNFMGKSSLRTYITGLLSGWEKEYGKDVDTEDIGLRFVYLIRQASKVSGMKVVVLVDEYDKPLLDVLGESVETENRNLLKILYGAFKAADEHLRFVMLTGVTKFSQVSVFSGFNQPEDISMNSRFDALCGITEAELHEYFDEEMAVMAKENGMTVEKNYQLLKRQYDGYHFSEKMCDIYNPFSVLNALSARKMYDFWFASGTPTYLMKLIDRDKVNVHDLLDRPYGRQSFVDYKFDTDMPLPMLYQSGYLTIRDVESDEYDTSYWLDFPNAEVRRGFTSLLANDYFHKDGEPVFLVRNISRMLRDCRLDDMRDTLTAFFASIPYGANQQAKAASFESHYHYTLYIIFRLLSCYTTFTEKQNSHGRADIIIETDDYVYIFEFKLDGTAKEALAQIDRQGYAVPYAADKRKLYKVGVNFSSKTRTIVEWKAELN